MNATATVIPVVRKRTKTKTNETAEWELLRRLRFNHRVSQSQIAAACKVRQGTVSKWENGDLPPNTQSMKALSEFFNIPLSELLQSAAQTFFVKKYS